MDKAQGQAGNIIFTAHPAKSMLRTDSCTTETNTSVKALPQDLVLLP